MNKEQLQVRTLDSLQELNAGDWDALLPKGELSGGPFLRWDFLVALERSGCVDKQSGWVSRHLILEKIDQTGRATLVAALPAYLKQHSYGEYVFDWAWADAYHRNGLEYYPKWVSAVPFSPIPGARLLGAQQWHELLARAWIESAQSMGVSSAHCLLPTPEQLPAFDHADSLVHSGVQFHWHNRKTRPYADFDDFLSTLEQPKRKKIRAERRKVRQAGVQVEALTGPQCQAADWDFFYRCYVRTYEEHGSSAYLNRNFFQLLAHTMPEHLVLMIARRTNEQGNAVPVAASLLVKDEHTLYGRYWGAEESIDCLHFELAYYAPIEWAIAHGLRCIQGGAQGEHKLARGFLPVTTYSVHWIADERFREAIGRFIERESQGVQAYAQELQERAPYYEKLADPL